MIWSFVKEVSQLIMGHKRKGTLLLKGGKGEEHN
jgi:hypothetical protein